MLKIPRFCVILNQDCNLHCKYCYRDKEKLDKIPDFTPDMIKYLQNISPDWCEAVVASGGEPLLHFDRVKEYFSYIPKNVHKKIMSNCTLLTQEMVNYINDNDIELSLSHDGAMTKFHRGMDVLSNPQTRDLLRQVKFLRCFCVITKYNTDSWANYFNTVTRLGRKDFFYSSFPMYDVPSQKHMIDGFDYDYWFQTYMELCCRPRSHQHFLKWYNARTLQQEDNVKGRPCGFNFLPNGIVCGMIRICSEYGNVFDDDYLSCRNQLIKLGDMDYCIQTNCKYKDNCDYPPQCTTPHICKCRKMVMEQFTNDKKVELRKYVLEHWEEIKERYGYKEI